MGTVVIIDYGMGNLKSIKSAINFLNKDIKVTITRVLSEIESADRIILPGVGHFDHATMKLEELEILQYLKEFKNNSSKPFLGICLGMQLMFEKSEESQTNAKGLNFFNYEVKRLKTGEERIPHIGFNSLSDYSNSLMFKGINSLDFYFVHSYGVLANPLDCNFSLCAHNEHFVSSIEKENIWGVQFHPELSQKSGLQLINNFLSL